MTSACLHNVRRTQTRTHGVITMDGYYARGNTHLLATLDELDGDLLPSRPVYHLLRDAEVTLPDVLDLHAAGPNLKA